jgi:hypothetical protein
MLLGALINVGSCADDVFPCETLAQFDMSFSGKSIQEKDLIDRDAAVYLKDTLANFHRVSQLYGSEY